MTTTKPIHELLYMTPEVYQEDYFERYLRWCMSFSTNKEQDLQKLLANRAISNYYNENFGKLQQKFIEAVTPIHGTVSYKIIRNMYTSITTQIFAMYPTPLFESARKLQILNQN